MTELPAGTVTFLLTDLESSTRLWDEQPEAMAAALARHDELVEETVSRHGGRRVKPRGEGDSLFCVFSRATEAVRAAVSLQQAMAVESWPGGLPLRLRIAVHTGEGDPRADDYYGSPVNRCARLRSIAHAGQTLVSAATRDLTLDDLPPGASLKDLGYHRLRDLRRPEHVFQLTAPGLADGFPPLRSLNALPHNLPQQATTFIGREREAAELRALLAGSTAPVRESSDAAALRTASRLVTLTGSGGAGKTRLAVQVAAELIDLYADGVWFVDLAPLADPALVPQAAAAALGVTEERGEPILGTLLRHLKERRLLLLLDNAEHMLVAAAHLAEAVLAGCPDLFVLVTTREALGVPGERLFSVPPLAVPDPRQPVSLEALTLFDSVRLFIDRALLVQPAFQVTNANAPALAELCARLDGIPLAIELAAARVRSMPVETIAARLDDRFRLLTGGSRTALPRQQTLRALIDWSYDLLEEKEKRLLRRLSVFAGGWTLEAAEAVCTDA